jgi:hypothetical protein
MCFSASASFIAAGVTGVAGGTALAGAKNNAHRLLAGIPIHFALHQFAEGVLWGTLTGGTDPRWQAPAMFFFLVIAQVVWPTWVPLAIRAVEEDPGRRRLMSVLLVLGIVESVALAYSLRTFAVTAEIAGSHIAYHIATPPVFRAIVDPLYAIVIVAPPLLSSLRLMRIIGVGVLVSLIVAKIAFYAAAASVWCFFAAFISVIIVMIVRAHAARNRVAPAMP